MTQEKLNIGFKDNKKGFFEVFEMKKSDNLQCIMTDHPLIKTIINRPSTEKKP
jgi:hypothetical protein